MTAQPMGLSRTTGRAVAINSLEHIHQSIAHVLTTPLGAAVMKRDYGSDLPDLIDQPMNGTLRLRIYAATAIAISRWEKRVRLRRIELGVSPEGQATLNLDLQRIDLPRKPGVSLSFPLNNHGLVGQLQSAGI